MVGMLDALQDIVSTDPETTVQPDPAQADTAVETELTEEKKVDHPEGEPAREDSESVTETQLTAEISELWNQHTQLCGTRRATGKELRLIRAKLAERLYQIKSLLSRPGRGGEWRGWLRDRGIPRSSADRLCARHSELLCADKENVPTEAASEPTTSDVMKFFLVLWPRIQKVLTTPQSVLTFLGAIASEMNMRCEWREEGLVVFNPDAEEEQETEGDATPPNEEDAGDGDGGIGEDI